MKRFLLVLTTLFVLCLASQALAADTTILFFYGEGCPHCAKEEVFLHEMLEKYPGLEVKALETYYNKDNHAVFEEITQKYNTTIQGVPTTFINDTIVVGYEDSMSVGIEYAIRTCMESDCISPVDVLSDESKATIEKYSHLPNPSGSDSSGKGLAIFLILIVAVITAILIIMYVSRKK